MVNYNQVTYIAAWIVIVWCILFIIAKRKLKAVELNSVEEYVKYDYTETQDSYGSVAKETITATYKSDDVFVSEKDGKGNLLKLTANNVVQLENVYDKKGQLDTLKDKVSGKNYKFERDELDNVTAVYEVDGSDVQISSGYGESVVYDALNRLIREDNKVMNKTVLFAYDNNGNILKQRKFAFTLKNAIDIKELDSEDKVYIYDGDKLLAFNGEECAYNETTNVQTTYRGKALGWMYGRVTSYNGVQFSYDGQGRRIAKGDIS